jgi:ABC transport system ATP-binding/permease protein
VVSHDRYFVERVCDDVYALTSQGAIRHLPGGIDQYVEERHAAANVPAPRAPAQPRPAATPGATLRAVRKDVQRLERELEKLDTREAALHEQMAENATDHERLRELQAELSALVTQREEAEAAWLAASEVLEG